MRKSLMENLYDIAPGIALKRASYTAVPLARLTGGDEDQMCWCRLFEDQ